MIELVDEDPVAVAIHLSAFGITTSYCYGLNIASGDVLWSVVIMQDGIPDDYAPLGARSLGHAAAIALHEAKERGWLG